MASFRDHPLDSGKVCHSGPGQGLSITNACYKHVFLSPQMPPAPLHWMVADRENCLVIEAVRHGLKIYDNPYGVLTNNPPFDYHLMNMNNYLNLTPQCPDNRFSSKLNLKFLRPGYGSPGTAGGWPPQRPALSGPRSLSGTRFLKRMRRPMCPSFFISLTALP